MSGTITIGFTRSNPELGYSSFSDGYRPEADQDEYVFPTQAGVYDIEQLAEAIFVASNCPGPCDGLARTFQLLLARPSGPVAVGGRHRAPGVRRHACPDGRLREARLEAAPVTRRPAPFERRLSVESVRRPDDRRRTAYWNYFAGERIVGSLSLVGSRDWGGRVDGFRALGITHPENGRRHLDRVDLGTFAYRAPAEAAIWAFANSLADPSTAGES